MVATARDLIRACREDCLRSSSVACSPSFRWSFQLVAISFVICMCSNSKLGYTAEVKINTAGTVVFDDDWYSLAVL